MTCSYHLRRHKHDGIHEYAVDTKGDRVRTTRDAPTSYIETAGTKQSKTGYLEEQLYSG